MKEIPISGGYVALVDDGDYERLAAYKWHAAKGRRGAIYAVRGAKRRKPDGKWRRFSREMQRDILDPEMKLPGSRRQASRRARNTPCGPGRMIDQNLHQSAFITRHWSESWLLPRRPQWRANEKLHTFHGSSAKTPRKVKSSAIQAGLKGR